MSVDSKMTSIADAIRAKTGRTDTLTLDEMASAINGISADSFDETLSYSQMNDVVAQFIDEVTYDPSDYSSSQIASYAGQTLSYDPSKPCGVELEIQQSGRLIVSDGYTGIATTHEVVDGPMELYNIVPVRNNHNFRGADYTVVNAGSGNASSSPDMLQSGHLHPTGQVRMIQCSTSNVRDLGGWACDGGTVKYGKLYRGGEFKTADADIFLKQLGIRHELNLRGRQEAEDYYAAHVADGDVILRDHIRYTCPENYVWYTIADAYKDDWREIIACVFEAAKYGEPLYFHCSAGADRTGTVACIIEALLGMSQSDIDKEYELTNFSSGTDGDSKARRRDESEWRGLINAITALTVGDTFRDKVANWVATLGFSADDINDFRKAVIDGSPEDIVLALDSYSVTNNLTNAATSNAATEMLNGQTYSADITPEDGYLIDSVTVMMGGTDITATAFTGVEAVMRYKVSKSLSNCSISGSSVISAGAAYSATITPDDGYTLDGGTVKVTMGGVDVTSSAYSGGVVSIAEVTGDVVITAVAVSTTETVPITWKPGYNCPYSVGSACTVTENASYIISDEVPVAYGKTYTLEITSTNADFGFKFVGVDSSGKVTEAANNTPGQGTHAVSWTPTIATTVGMRVRGYASAKSFFTAVTELTVS